MPASLALVLALAAARASTVELRLDRPDHFLPAPAGQEVTFKLDARTAPPKCRILFTTPRPAGQHRYRIEIAGGRVDHTLIIATPVTPGRSVFEVSVTGQGRVDLGFWSSGPAPREYRFTVVAPVKNRRFQLELPASKD